MALPLSIPTKTNNNLIIAIYYAIRTAQKWELKISVTWNFCVNIRIMFWMKIFLYRDAFSKNFSNPNSCNHLVNKA